MLRHIVFVYGTLLRGEANHALLRGAERLEADARVRGALYDTGCGYPALVLEEGAAEDSGAGPAGPVAGEVYAVDGRMLAELDALEDYWGPGDPRNLYERVEAAVSVPGGEMRALVYVFPAERAAGLARIDGGDWRAYRRRGGGG